MGLLDFLRGNSSDQPVAGNAAHQPIGSYGQQAAPVDNRPQEPDELTSHFHNDCVRVYLTEEGRYLLSSINIYGTMSVKVRKAPKSDENGDYYVKLTDDRLLGYLRQYAFDKALPKTRGEITAEVIGPIYAGDNCARLYIPISEEAIKRRDLKIWVSIDGGKWSGPQEVREEGGEILESRKGSGKPSYVIVAGNTRLCEITSRMDCYEAVAERSKYPLRLVIAEPRVSDYGPYWRLGLYF